MIIYFEFYTDLRYTIKIKKISSKLKKVMFIPKLSLEKIYFNFEKLHTYIKQIILYIVLNNKNHRLNKRM